MSQVRITVQLPNGHEVFAGVLSESPSPTGGTPFVTFRYDSSYLSTPGAYNLSPDLSLDSAMQRPPVHRKMFMGLEDSGPDRWGRNLLQEDERITARQEVRRYGRLSVFETLCRVPDDTRQGAIRFWTDEKAVAPAAHPERIDLVDWSTLLEAVINVEEFRDLDSALQVLFQHGSASPGGARPKINVTGIDDSLYLAKFPAHGDRWDVSLWESITLALAQQAGVAVPEFKLHRFGEEQSILFLRRFDRDGGRRIGYQSARSLLQLDDHEIERSSYLELAHALRRVAPRTDLHELYRRIAFTLLVSNADDHMRNHGVLRSRHGWCLSPAFDINPALRGSVESTPLTPRGDPTHREMRELLELHDAFDLSKDDAISTIRQVALVTSGWVDVARRHGADPETFDFFARMFEHEQSEWASQI